MDGSVARLIRADGVSRAARFRGAGTSCTFNINHALVAPALRFLSQQSSRHRLELPAQTAAAPIAHDGTGVSGG